MSEQVLPRLPKWVRFYAEGSLAKDQAVQRQFLEDVCWVVAQIPGGHLDTIIDDLADHGRESIEIRLMDNYHGFRAGSSGDANAQCGRQLGVTELTYRSLNAKRYSPECRRCWIAHEFAHAYLHVIDPAHGKQFDQAEREVSQLLRGEWGYSAGVEERLNIETYFIALRAEFPWEGNNSNAKLDG